MELLNKLKSWWAANGPNLEGASENKYVAMVYDRFGSLPPAQQRQVTIGVFSFVGFILIIVFFFSYSGLRTLTLRASQSKEMISLLQQYQKESQASGGGSQTSLGGNGNLVARGSLRNHLEGQARKNKISARMMKVDEKLETKPASGGEKGSVKVKRATVNLERVNLNQLVGFLQSVEHGNFDLSVSSLKITNDRQVRGYMNVDMGIVAYIVSSEG